MQFYSTALIRDAANMRLQFLVGSIERKGGYVFSQFYSELQVSFNAAKTYPFANPGYENLAVDLSLMDAMSYASGNVAFGRKISERGYLKAKFGHPNKSEMPSFISYGMREEHRISIELFDAMQTKLVERSQRQGPPAAEHNYLVPHRRVSLYRLENLESLALTCYKDGTR